MARSHAKGLKTKRRPEVMAMKGKNKTHDEESDTGKPGKLKNRAYDKELERLHVELVKLQQWVVHKGLKVCVVFEGRDGAGKGGTIKAITDRVSHRIFRVVALPSPTEREKSQMYVQRYMRHFPAAGEIVIFDRSWYNRAGVEYVMGFCTPEERDQFLEVVPQAEKFIVDTGIQLIKYWLEVSNEEQSRRFEARIHDPLRQWKLSPVDLASRRRWYDSSKARDEMFDATDTAWAPWHIVRSDANKHARLNCISHLLTLIPYKAVERPKVKMPKRSMKQAYDDMATMKERRW